MSNLKSKLLHAMLLEQQSGGEGYVLEDSTKLLRTEYGRRETLASLLSILQDRSDAEYWYLSASAMYFIVADCRNLDSKEYLACHWSYLTAVMYRCLEIVPELGVYGVKNQGDNLVWSIVHIVRGVSYTSRWDPLKDLTVLKHLEALRKLE